MLLKMTQHTCKQMWLPVVPVEALTLYAAPSTSSTKVTIRRLSSSYFAPIDSSQELVSEVKSSTSSAWLSSMYLWVPGLSSIQTNQSFISKFTNWLPGSKAARNRSKPINPIKESTKNPSTARRPNLSTWSENATWSSLGTLCHPFWHHSQLLSSYRLETGPYQCNERAALWSNLGLLLRRAVQSCLLRWRQWLRLHDSLLHCKLFVSAADFYTYIFWTENFSELIFSIESIAPSEPSNT